MKSIIILLFVAGHLSTSAQQFSISPSLGIVKSIISINRKTQNLGNIKPATPVLFEYGLVGEYHFYKHSIVAGFRSLSCAYGYYLKPDGFTPFSAYNSHPLKQILLGYSYRDKLGHKSVDNIEGLGIVKFNLSGGIALNKAGTSEENLNNAFLPGNSYNETYGNETAWLIGIEKPKFTNKINSSIWFQAGLFALKREKTLFELSFLFNLGLYDMYIIETNNKYGNTRTGQLIREEQFNVVSKGTSMALMLSYPIYFGKRK